MAYVNCKKCGCQMSDKSEACPMCGMPIGMDLEEFNKQNEVQQQTPEVSVQNEPPVNNGVETAPNSTGNNESAVPPAPVVPNNPKKSNKKPLIIGIVAAVVVVAAAVVFFLMKGNKGNVVAEEETGDPCLKIDDSRTIYDESYDDNVGYNSNGSKLKGYEWLKGVWAGAEGSFFGRVIVTDTYYQVVNSNMDDAFDAVEARPKEDITLKEWVNYADGDNPTFGFSEYIGIDRENQLIYIIQGEYFSLALHKIQSDFESAVFIANHQYPKRVYSNAYDGFVNIRQSPNGKAPILGVLRNGPDGAVLIGTEGEWKEVNCHGVVGYVSGKYVQDTPTEVFKVWEVIFNKDASTYHFTENDLKALSAKELTYLRNSVYAKHGYVFKSQELNGYFKQFGWYHPNVSVTDAILNEVEKDNVKFIKNYQEQNSKTYKPL